MNNVSIDVYSSRRSRLQKGFRKKLYILQCWFDSRVDGKIRIRKKLLSKRNSTCNSRTKQYAIFMDKTFCRIAHVKKIAAMSVFQVIAFLEKKTVIRLYHRFFNIYMCARRFARTNRVVDFDFAFFSVELTYWQKRKIAARIHENLRSEFFKIRYNAFVKSRVELKNAICRIEIIIDKTLMSLVDYFRS